MSQPTTAVGDAAIPRYQTLPTEGADGWWEDIEKAAVDLDTPLMPWQSQGARLLGELSEEMCRCHDPAIPLPRYKTVMVTVPRQQGKTALSRAGVATVAEREDYQELFGTAQSRQYAAKHVVKLGEALQRAEGVGIEKVSKGVGNERVVWNNGSSYMPISPNEGGGHGDSIAFMLVDEGWKLTTEVLGGIRPAMIAKPHSQMLIISTMGTVDSTVWNGMVEAGREATEGKSVGRVAYIEYSAPSDEAVFNDTCTEDGEEGCIWGQWMPALGITVSHADIRDAITDMMSDPEQGRSEVIRAFGNRTVASLVTLFPTDWIEDAWRVIEPSPRAVVAVDVNESPPGATVSIGYIDAEDRAAVKITEWRYGTPKWVPKYVEQMLRRDDREIEAIVADLGGPARTIKGELTQLAEDNVVALVDRVPKDFAADSQNFYDGLRQGTVALEKSEPLEEAIAKAVRKDLSDTGLWVVSRGRMTVDASPLIAAILAHGLARELDIKPRSQFFIG